MAPGPCFELLTLLLNMLCMMQKLVIVPGELVDLLLEFLNAQPRGSCVSTFKLQGIGRGLGRGMCLVELRVGPITQGLRLPPTRVGL